MHFRPRCVVWIVFIHLRMETPLRGRSGGHAGTAPTVSFGQIARGRLVAFGWIVCKWLFGLCEIVWKNMMEMGRGSAYVEAY